MWWKVAVVLSGVVVVAWALIIATWPSDDAQIGIGYVFTTLYALVALLLVWGVAGLIARGRRRRARRAQTS